MSKSTSSRRNINRIKAIIITMVLAVITNIAISYAAGVTTQTYPPRPVAKSAEQHAGVTTQTYPPRPVAKSVEQHTGLTTQTYPPRP